MAEKLRVAVLFGGQSGEHEVSLASAQAVMAGLDSAKYDVVPIGITKEGRWLAGPQIMPALLAAADPARLPGGVGNAEVRIENEDRAEHTAPVSDTQLLASQPQFSILNSQFSIDV